MEVDFLLKIDFEKSSTGGGVEVRLQVDMNMSRSVHVVVVG